MEKRAKYLTISQAADLLGVTPATLRNWDKMGKLVAERDPMSGYRMYSFEQLSFLVDERSASHKEGTSDLAWLTVTSRADSRSKTVDTRDLRFLVRRMNRAFRDSLGGGLLERFEEMSKLLYCKLYDEQRSHHSPGYKYQFVRLEGESVAETYARVERLYREAAMLLPDVSSTSSKELSADHVAVAHIVEILQDVSLSAIPADVKGVVYEELIRNTFDKTENQQFFTPRPVVTFMVEFVDPQPTHVICDPACGSGGFLIETVHYVIQKSGGRPHDLVADRAIQETSDRIVGLEIDRRMAWIAQMNLMMHGDGRANVHHLPGGGSLAFSSNINSLVPPGYLDLILTNPPFGSDFSETAHLDKYILGKGRASRRRGVLFVERSLHWLKPGGRLAIVIDESVLNGASNQDVRELILAQCIVEAIVSLPDVTFMPYSTAKTSILFLRKRHSHDEIQPPIFMANVENVGRKPNGDPLYGDHRDSNGQPILLNDLPEIVKAWRAYQHEGERAILDLAPAIFGCPPERFTAGRGADDGLRFDVQFHHPSRKTAEDILRRSTYPTPTLAELVVVRDTSAVPNLQDPDDVWRYTGLANITANTGEYTVSEVLGSQIKSSARLGRAGDILFSRLRPELRKCVLIGEEEDELYASSECLVLCPLPTAAHDPDLRRLAERKKLSARWEVDGEYLAFMLRSDLVFGQLVYQITGVGRPRVAQSAILGLRIPLPPLDVQREIVAAYRMARQQYLALRRQSEIAVREGETAIRLAYSYATERLCPEE